LIRRLNRNQILDLLCQIPVQRRTYPGLLDGVAVARRRFVVL